MQVDEASMFPVPDIWKAAGSEKAFGECLSCRTEGRDIGTKDMRRGMELY